MENTEVNQLNAAAPHRNHTFEKASFCHKYINQPRCILKCFSRSVESFMHPQENPLDEHCLCSNFISTFSKPGVLHVVSGFTLNTLHSPNEHQTLCTTNYHCSSCTLSWGIHPDWLSQHHTNHYTPDQDVKHIHFTHFTTTNLDLPSSRGTSCQSWLLDKCSWLRHINTSFYFSYNIDTSPCCLTTKEPRQAFASSICCTFTLHVNLKKKKYHVERGSQSPPMNPSICMKQE